MLNSKFVFSGNRFFVLEEMLQLGLDVKKIYAVKDSFLQKVLEEKNIGYFVLPKKEEFVSQLKNESFDYFVGNGCPVILPISYLKKDNQKQFINVHTSYLPDLKGSDPVPGAILYGKDSGATCHYMDDTIDTGPIISQIRIPMTPDLEAGLLYQLSFLAEKEVFLKAYKRNFEILKEQSSDDKSYVYYTFSNNDLKIDFSDDYKNIIRKVKAFSTRSKGAYFLVGDSRYIVWDIEELNNNFLLKQVHKYQHNEIFLRYENCLIIKRNDAPLKLKNISGDISKLSPGFVLD